MMKNILPYFFGLLLVACQSVPGKEDTAAASSAEVSDTLEKIPFTPCSGEESGIIVTPGVFHGDEATDDWKEKEWLGLFETNGVYELKPVVLSMTRVNDPIVDGEGEATGREIKARGDEQPLFFITGVSCLKAGICLLTRGEVSKLMPGDSLMVGNLTLKGSGEEKQGNGERVVENYALTIYEPGRPGQPLLQVPNYNDELFGSFWAGDMDGDGKADLIINTSDHYNVTQFELLMSSGAGKNNILVPVAVHRSVGC